MSFGRQGADLEDRAGSLGASSSPPRLADIRALPFACAGCRSWAPSPVDSERSSQLRALALASRCLAREIRRLKDGPKLEDQDDTCRFEIQRAAPRARTILDPSYSPDRPKPGAPRAPAKKKSVPENPLIDLLGDGPPSPEHTLGGPSPRGSIREIGRANV